MLTFLDGTAPWRQFHLIKTVFGDSKVHETVHSACGIIILSISHVSKRKKIRRSERQISQETKMKLSPILLSAVAASSKVERSASTGKYKFLFFLPWLVHSVIIFRSLGLRVSALISIQILLISWRYYEAVKI